MIGTREFMIRAELDAASLDAWVESGWLMPNRDADGLGFSEVDLARAHLIRDLTGTLGINDEGVTVVLDLLDQIYGLRLMLRDVLSAFRENAGVASGEASQRPLHPHDLD